MTLCHPDRLLPSEPAVRAIARRLYDAVCDLPLVCPHGHCDPAWFAEDAPFRDPAQLLIVPDHYLLRMLRSQGVPYAAMGVGPDAERDPRRVWRTFAAHYHLFCGTPSRIWLDHTFETLFGLTERLSERKADACFDRIAECLADPAYRPRALFERFGIEVLATTDSALDDLSHHAAIRASGWSGLVVPTYRPDDVVDPDRPGFAENLRRLGEITGEDTATWEGYLAAHRARRDVFRAAGATATDHGHPTAETADLPPDEARTLFEAVCTGRAEAAVRELFRAQMLTEMAAMSVEDGLVMQLHAGSMRNHHPDTFRALGPDAGVDIPVRTEFTRALAPLLARHGMDDRLRLVLFTLDESTYARELAPLAGVYPSVVLGAPWWFFDSPAGMQRHRARVVETAGFANLAGFNDDTRAFPSIPARHDMARRVDCAFLAEGVARHDYDEAEATELARALATDLARRTYRFDRSR